MKYTITTTSGGKITKECKNLDLYSRIKMREAMEDSTIRHFITGEYVEIKSVVFKD